jgi:hypothetical protein
MCSDEIQSCDPGRCGFFSKRTTSQILRHVRSFRARHKTNRPADGQLLVLTRLGADISPVKADREEVGLVRIAEAVAADGKF